ncbi:MAG: hypothetical protein Q4C47_06165, partial [Planctomycetia bacterium]|nr:hypothetical protein [Planctomycetia bacterium]
VLLYADRMRVNDAGLTVTKDGDIPATEYVRDLLRQSPHWVPVSQGGGSNPGHGTVSADRKTLSEQAKKEGNFSDMIRYAPTVESRIAEPVKE